MKQKNTLGYVIFMAVVAAIGGILFGYDTAVISGTTAIVKSQFGLTDAGEGWYVGCALIGSICGVLVAGSLSDYLGRKLTMLISAALFSISAIGCAICGSFDSLVAYRIVGGVGIGIVSIVSPIYISEVSPAKIRGTLVSLYQLAVTVGFLLAYMANWIIDINGKLTVTGDLWVNIWNSEMWRGMLGSETLPALLFFFVIFFIPESPKWLIVNGKLKKASSVLSKIYFICSTRDSLAITLSLRLHTASKISGWDFLNASLLDWSAVSRIVPSAKTRRAEISSRSLFAHVPQLIPEALFIMMPPTIQLFMDAGSGPNFLPYLERKSFTFEPITPGCKLTVNPSSSVLILSQFFPATISTESLTDCPDRLVPAALKVTGTLLSEADLRILATCSSEDERITIFGISL